MGDCYLRKLLVVGAISVVRRARSADATGFAVRQVSQERTLVDGRAYKLGLRLGGPASLSLVRPLDIQPLHIRDQCPYQW